MGRPEQPARLRRCSEGGHMRIGGRDRGCHFAAAHGRDLPEMSAEYNHPE